MGLLVAGGIDLGRLRDDEIQRHFLAVAVDLHRDGVAGSLLGFDGVEVIRRGHGFARELGDDVALLQAGTLSRAHAGNLGDIHADRHGILLAHVFGDVANGDAQHNLAALGLILDGIRIVDHLSDKILDVVDRDGVADAFDAHGRALGHRQCR